MKKVKMKQNINSYFGYNTKNIKSCTENALRFTIRRNSLPTGQSQVKNIFSLKNLIFNYV